MGFYEERILPHLINLAMRNRYLVPYRERALSAAEGRVLEIGIGSGLNLPFYGPAVREVVGIEPSPRLLVMTRDKARGAAMPVKLVEGSAEAMPLDNGSIDTVVTTWTLCTIPQAVDALQEARRVLKAGGRLVFVEHGQSPDANVHNWQRRLTPVWRRIGGGCHLDRPIAQLVETAGFEITGLETGYAKGPKPMAFMYEGLARP